MRGHRKVGLPLSKVSLHFGLSDVGVRRLVANQRGSIVVDRAKRVLALQVNASEVLKLLASSLKIRFLGALLEALHRGLRVLLLELRVHNASG